MELFEAEKAAEERCVGEARHSLASLSGHLHILAPLVPRRGDVLVGEHRDALFELFAALRQKLSRVTPRRKPRREPAQHPPLDERRHALLLCERLHRKVEPLVESHSRAAVLERPRRELELAPHLREVLGVLAPAVEAGDEAAVAHVAQRALRLVTTVTHLLRVAHKRLEPEGEALVQKLGHRLAHLLLLLLVPVHVLDPRRQHPHLRPPSEHLSRLAELEAHLLHLRHHRRPSINRGEESAVAEPVERTLHHLPSAQNLEHVVAPRVVRGELLAVHHTLERRLHLCLAVARLLDAAPPALERGRRGTKAYPRGGTLKELPMPNNGGDVFSPTFERGCRLAQAHPGEAAVHLAAVLERLRSHLVPVTKGASHSLVSDLHQTLFQHALTAKLRRGELAPFEQD
mmetsp:Transcript_8232/g.27350  ORF Transcript_8232/g.27350 Transcript_8232/m.27350 type:complete len:402 (-) Transcript_8232:1697-2902(-)